MFNTILIGNFSHNGSPCCQRLTWKFCALIGRNTARRNGSSIAVTIQARTSPKELLRISFASTKHWPVLQKKLPVIRFAIPIPDTLNTLVFQNQRELYTILFKAVAETLQELASDKKYLGATLGFTSILHTWGQNPMHHPFSPN